MPSYVTGTVEEVVENSADVQVLTVRTEEGQRRAILFTRYAAPATAGDRVVLNTTAAELGLGSGGEDFVVWNLAAEHYRREGGGHIMKLRYTPLQSEVLAVEAPESPHHEVMERVSSLDGMPVVAASLHSQLLPVVVGLRLLAPGAKVAYVMTEGGALEAGLSQTVRRLRQLGWIACTITAGHALGGDLEAVNLYSALLAARYVAGCEVAVAGMGPGVVGTATAFGTSALELGQTLNATGALGGRPVAAVRMSAADARRRHAGLSHHARTALVRVALVRAEVPVPAGCAGGLEDVRERHEVVEVETGGVVAALAEAEELGLRARHMGRGPHDDPLFFSAAGAAGLYAGHVLRRSG